MNNQLKEYTGIGASGGNSTDGNDIPSPRPFVDDEAEMNNYLEKNRYGGEGNHYRKEPALPNPNRTRFTKFEENMKNNQIKEGDLDLGHEDNEPHMIKADLYRIGKYALGLYKMVDQFDGEGEVDFPSWWQAKITKSKDYLIGAKHYLDFELKKPQIDASVNEMEMGMVSTDDEDKAAELAKKGINVNLKEMKNTDLLKDYMSSRKDTNLNEQMETYQKEAKRGLLMESAMRKFFELFEMGRTDEEIVLDYANKGVQVPEQFVSKVRGQYENLKKMKLELDMSEKEFKNSAKDIVNNPDEQVVNSEEKTLSSGIYESKKTK